MAATLIESIQKNLGFEELHKIDPNTQAVKQVPTAVDPQHLGQAAIPTVLFGLYKYGNTEQGSAEILSSHIATSWLDLFFTDKKDEIITKVAAYSGVSANDATTSMEKIATEAVRLVREQTPANATSATVKSFVAEQRTNILTYLPAELQISSSFDDGTLDDRTNKMEGPMSNSMHFFEKLFSGSTTEKNELRNDDNK